MIALKKQSGTPRYVPDYMAASIEKIDFKLLADQGVKYIAFDADSTLVPYRGLNLSESSKQYLRKQKELFEGWCIASNRLTNDLHDIARELDAGIVRAGVFTRKPKLRFFRRVLRYFGARPEEVAMIGDKVVADIWGGNRAGMITVWVEHLGKDSLPDRLIRLRKLEKRILKQYR